MKIGIIFHKRNRKQLILISFKENKIKNNLKIKKFTPTNITYSDGVVTFNVTNSNTLGISGSVLNSDGEPLAGATITFNVEATQNNAPAKASANSGTNQLISKARRLLFPSSSRMNALSLTSR